jgi:hypothetical protein
MKSRDENQVQEEEWFNHIAPKVRQCLDERRLDERLKSNTSVPLFEPGSPQAQQI